MFLFFLVFFVSMQPLKVVGRVLVGEGVLTKMCRKRPKARQFFLFNDILVYGNIVISKKKYNKQHIIPLEEVQLQGLEDNGRKWKCHTIANHNQFIFGPMFSFINRISKWMAYQNGNKIICCVCSHKHRKTRMDGSHK